MPRKKYIEANLPIGLKAEVRYHKGRHVPWVTSCHLVSAEGKVLASGLATCSAKDQPVRKIGRAMAIGRALKSYAKLHQCAICSLIAAFCSIHTSIIKRNSLTQDLNCGWSGLPLPPAPLHT